MRSFLALGLIFLFLASTPASANLPAIPEVGPGVCAWKQPNGQPCDESTQRCAEGCPPLPSYSYPPSSYDTSSGSSSSSSSSESSRLWEKECREFTVKVCREVCNQVAESTCLRTCLESSEMGQVRRYCVKTGRFPSIRITKRAPPPVVEEPKVETPKPFKFKVTASRTYIKVEPGGIAPYPFRVDVVEGKPEEVAVSIGGKGVFDLVEHARSDWNIGGVKGYEGVPPFSSTLNVITTKDTIPGIYPLHIRGASEKASDAFPITLEVLAVEKDPWEGLKKKLDEGATPTVSQDEFLQYLRKLEEKNPKMTRAQLIAKLHEAYYAFDINTKVPIFGKLFKQGSETEGYEQVDLLAKRPPRYVIQPDGTKVDIAHSYAALRSDLNRADESGFRRNYMRDVNTHWGDLYQVGQWAWRYKVKGEKIPPWQPQNFGDALGYASPEQLRGNDVGLGMTGFYDDKNNKDKPLSLAYADILGR